MKVDVSLDYKNYIFDYFTSYITTSATGFLYKKRRGTYE